jgi:hypothetical protein
VISPNARRAIAGILPAIEILMLSRAGIAIALFIFSGRFNIVVAYGISIEVSCYVSTVISPAK